MFKKLFKNDIADLAFRLFAITASVAILLSVANYLTKERIIINQREKTQTVMNEIFPDNVITEITGSFDLSQYGDTVSTVYSAKKDGVLTGLCVYVTPQGYGGEINMVVGVNNSVSVETVKIVSASETPGVGSKALTDEFLSGFCGMSPTNTEFHGVTGATISSKGINNGISTALKVAKELIINEK